MRDSSYKKPGDVIVTVPITPALHKRLRHLSVETGKSIKVLVTEAIERIAK